MIRTFYIRFDQALELLTHPEIFQRIKEDGATEKDIRKCRNSDHLFIGNFLGAQLIGVWWLIPLTCTTIDLHTHIRPEFREHKYDCWQGCLNVMAGTLPSLHKVQARIPKVFPEVYAYAKNNGMKDEGTERESKLINGVFHDQWIVGATLSELTEACNGRS